MGNSSVFGNIRIHLPSNSIEGGKEVKGCVLVKIFEEIAGATLYLTFKGKQEIRWVEVDRSGSQIKREASCNDYCRYKLILCTWITPVYPGVFEVPFAFTTPKALPSTFIFNSGTSSATIQYRFKSKLTTSNKSIKARRTVAFIGQKSPPRISSAVTLYSKLYALLLFNRGICKVHANFSGGSLKANEPLVATFDIDNSASKANVCEVICRLFRVVRIFSNDFVKVRIAEDVIIKSVEVYVRAGELSTGEDAVRLEFCEEEVRGRIRNLESTRTELIDCRYFIEFSLRFAEIAMWLSNTTKGVHCVDIHQSRSESLDRMPPKL